MQSTGNDRGIFSSPKRQSAKQGTTFLELKAKREIAAVDVAPKQENGVFAVELAPTLVKLAFTAHDLPSPSSPVDGATKGTPHFNKAVLQLQSVATGTNPMASSVLQSTGSVSDRDVLKDAEAYMWGKENNNDASDDSQQSSVTERKYSATSKSGDTGSFTAFVRSLLNIESCESEMLASAKETIIVAELSSVRLGDSPTESSCANEFFSDALEEEPSNVPRLTFIHRCTSVTLSHDDVHVEVNSDDGGVDGFKSTVGPVAPYTITNEGQEAFRSAYGRINNSAAQFPLPPLLIASEEVELAKSGPTNWVERSVVAARVAASRAAVGAAEMTATQVPGGAIAVAVVNRSAASVTVTRTTEVFSRAKKTAAVSSSAVIATGTAAAAPTCSSDTPNVSTTSAAPPPAAPSEFFVATLRTNSKHAQSTVSATATQRQQQLKLYIKQNFVPTLSDFVPSSNQLVERAAVKAKSWVTMPVKPAATKAGTERDKGTAASGSTAVVAAAPVEEEVRVESPSPDTVVLHATAEEWQAAGKCKRISSSEHADKSNMRTTKPLHTKQLFVKADGNVTPAPAATSTVTANETEEVATVTWASGGNIIPYATIRVLLCRCDSMARNGNVAVDAFEKFWRMPCKRKLQEIFSNFASNLLPRPSKKEKQSPFKEVLQLYSQQVWSGTAPEPILATDATCPALTARKREGSVTGGRTLITSTEVNNQLMLQLAALTTENAPAGMSATGMCNDLYRSSELKKNHAPAFGCHFETKSATAPDTNDSSPLRVNPLSPSTAATVKSHTNGEISGKEDAVPLSNSGGDYTLLADNGHERGFCTGISSDNTSSLSATSLHISTDAAYQAYMSYGQRTVLYNTQYDVPQLRGWARAFPCCCSAATCREGCCCLHCQLARQCNMLNYRRPTVLFPLCLLMCVLDPCTCLMCSSMLACVNRATARARYGIAGSFLGDCAFALFCTRCVAAQVMDEMTAHGEYPGGLCMLPPTSTPSTSSIM